MELTMDTGIAFVVGAALGFLLCRVSKMRTTSVGDRPEGGGH
ncbi:MAG: hypothetical protein ACREBO_12810 [Novosphingobium sp.]